MKRLFFASAMLVLLSTASFAGKPFAKGKTFSSLGDYKIELSDNAIPINGSDCKAYSITYQNSPMDVMLVVCKDTQKKCMKYVVLSDKVSVQYVCNENYFGVELLDKALQKEGYASVNNSLNRAAFFHQKKITDGSLSEGEAVKLVAAYFPFLINETGNPTAEK